MSFVDSCFLESASLPAIYAFLTMVQAAGRIGVTQQMLRGTVS